MRQVTNIIVTCACAYWLTSGEVFGDSQPGPENDVRDIFKLLEMHPNGVAILDTDEDGDLECLTAVRTKFDKEGPAADYVWILKGLNGHPKRNITVHFKKGDAPDKALVTVDDAEDRGLESRLIYVDYQTCAVMEIPYNDNTQCMLWTTENVKDDVPSKCTEEFRKNCYKEVIAYDKESCNQV